MDHMPLGPLFNRQDLYKSPLQFQRRLMRMMRFKAKAEHVPGKELVVADTLSRNPLVNVTEASDLEEDVIHVAYVDAFMMSELASLEKLEQMKQATLSDPQLSLVLNELHN